MPSDLLPGYRFNRASGRYISNETGRFVARSLIVELLDRHVAGNQERLANVTRALHEGQISPALWAEQMRTELKRQHLQNRALGAGGWDRLTARDFGAVGGRLSAEYRYLEGFARDVADGKVTLAQALNRANMYAGNARVQFWSAQRDRTQPVQPGNVIIERRMLGSAEHCEDCVSYYDRGWTVQGTLPVPGTQSACMSNCRCTIVQREVSAAEADALLGRVTPRQDSPSDSVPLIDSGSEPARQAEPQPVLSMRDSNDVTRFIGRDGQEQQNTWDIGRIGDTNLLYRDQSFTGNPPSAELLEKYRSQAETVVADAMRRIPEADRRLVKNIFIEEYRNTGLSMHSGAAAGDNMFITSVNGNWEMGPGGIVHEIGHNASFNLTGERAERWLRAVGWDGDFSDPVQVLRDATPNNHEWFKYRAVTEYGTVHPGESFAEAYRLAYAPDATVHVGSGDWDWYEDEIPRLTDLIRSFAR